MFPHLAIAKRPKLLEVVHDLRRTVVPRHGPCLLAHDPLRSQRHPPAYAVEGTNSLHFQHGQRLGHDVIFSINFMTRATPMASLP